MQLHRSVQGPQTALWAAVASATLHAQVCLSTSLAVTQPGGPGSLLVAVTIDINDPTCTAGETCFCAFTLNPANATGVPDGWWGGLHISVFELIAEFASGIEPFISTIPASGIYTFSLPPGAIDASFSGVTVYGIARTFSPATLYLTGSSDVVSITLS